MTDKIIEMFNAGRLKFSFEIWAAEVSEEDGVVVVDANPDNQLTAMAIVTTPAIPSAVALKLAAELDIHAFEDKVWRLLDSKFRMPINIIWMSLDYAVVYIPEGEHMLRIGYKLDNGELVETETYEVTFAPTEEVNDEMDKELNAEVTNVETPVVEEVATVAEEVANMNTVETAEEKNESAECGTPEEEKAEEEVAEAEPVNAEVDALRQELEQAKAKLAEYEAAEANARMAEKREAAKKYAEREHLDLNAESVKTAIENADYEALAAEVMAKPIDNKDNEAYRVVAEIKMESPFGNMFEKAN